MHTATPRFSSTRSARMPARRRRMSLIFTGICGLALASALLATTAEGADDSSPSPSIATGK